MPVARRAIIAALLLSSACTRQTSRAEQARDQSVRRPRVVQNHAAAITSHVDQLGPSGALGLNLTGAGVLLGEWDQGGVRTTHVDLRTRVSVLDGAGATDHGTHVAGTIIGSGMGQPAALGMAPGARLLDFDWTFDRVELRQWAPYLVASNHAYGFRMGWGNNPACADVPTWFGRADEAEDRAFGKYGPEAVALDELAHDTGLLMVWAGGNERQDTGAAGGQPHHHFPECTQTFDDDHESESALQYDTLGLELAAKNTLVVGAAAHVMSDPASSSDVQVLPFSGFGPMDDGRIKPELLASGAQIFSCVSSADDAYADYSGTSSSAAVVTGGIALLAERYRRLNDGVDLRADAMKALLVHSALSQDGQGGPNYGAGFGLFDARAAAELIEADAGSAPGRLLRLARIESEGTVELPTVSSVPAGTALRVTLVWLDPAGAPNAGGVDDPSSALVNDLDLTLIAPDGTAFYPWSLDPRDPSAAATRSGPNHVDNIEVLDVPEQDNAFDGTWTVRVSAGPLDRGVPQTFALVSGVPLAAASGVPLLAAPRSVVANVAAGTSPSPVDVPLRNVGEGALAFTAAPQAPWLSVTPNTGTLPTTLELSFDTSALAPGDHFTTLVLESDDPSGPRAIGVALHVGCTPDCSGRSCGPDPLCGLTCGGCQSGESCGPAGQCAAWQSTCPAADLGSQLGPLLLNGSSQGATNLQAGSCGGSDGPELTFSWTAPAAGLYRFGTDGSAIDTVLYLRSTCDGPELACNDDSDDATSALALALDKDQTVTVFVDSAQVGGGDVHLAIERAVCPDADLGSALGETLVSADLAGSLDRMQGTCGGAGTPEAVFMWTAPSAGDYVFSARGSDAAVLYVLDGGCAGGELGCAAVSAGPLALTLNAGQTVAVAVDGSPDAPVTLSIVSAAGLCAGNCDGTPNHRACYCDPACVALGDCCPDACDTCGHCCVPDCDNKACGDDGCGSNCGDCPTGFRCDKGECIHDACSNVLTGGACDDGDACTANDVCIGGRCAGVAISCKAPNGCTAAECNPTSGTCEFTHRVGCCLTDSDCNDGNACTSDRCREGECRSSLVNECETEANPSSKAHADGGASTDGGPNDGASGCGCRVARPSDYRIVRWPWAMALVLFFRRRYRR